MAQTAKSAKCVTALGLTRPHTLSHFRHLLREMEQLDERHLLLVKDFIRIFLDHQKEDPDNEAGDRPHSPPSP